MNFPTPDFCFNHRLFNRELFKPRLLNPDLSTPSMGLKNPGLRNPGLESSWLKSPGWKGLGLKLGVEKSGVEMSFNLLIVLVTFMCTVLNSQAFYREYLVGLRIRTGLISAIYRKSLRLSNAARKQMTGTQGFYFSNFSCMFLNPNNFFQFKF